LRRLAVEVGVFVHREGRLLVCHRAREDYWHIVAGALEEGEAPVQAARRELREETGLQADPIDLGFQQRYAVTDGVRDLFAEGTEEVVIGNFHVEAPAGWEPLLNEEHDRYDWADIGVARELMHWPETREAIDVLAQRLHTARSRNAPSSRP
jgi:8-oxo-dGTP pyrophosphatase MutT (NUDIX family)